MVALHDTPRFDPPTRTLPLPRRKRRLTSRRPQFETLEERTLLSATLFVTSPATLPDATHFSTLQAALAAAVAGDTVILQSGFAAGTFLTTSLSVPASAGANTIRTWVALDIGDVVTIGTVGSYADPAERALVVAVTPGGSGDFLLTLADPLQLSHGSSPVDAVNGSSIGKTIGINKAITLTAEAGVVLPFNLQLWKGTSGANLSNLNLTAAGATSLYVDGDGNTLDHIIATNQVVLTNAHNNTLAAVTVGNRLYVDTGSSGNVVTGSTFPQVALRPGSHHNTFRANAIGALTATGGLSGNGYDVFEQNTFTGAVKITGNRTTPTNDVLANNTFAQSTADGLNLIHADGTLVTGNTITVSKSGGCGLIVNDSVGVVVVGNRITAGSYGTAIYAFADLANTTTLDVRDNTLSTSGGWGLYFCKYATTATFQARVQANDLRQNAVGVYVYGDGFSGGVVDLGGGATAFGASTGGNDFRSFTAADATHYAIGVMATDAAYTLPAQSNRFALLDPLSVISDATHNLAAGGTGTILATATVLEALTLSAQDVTLIQSQSNTGILAHFSSDLPHVAADFLVTLTCSDGGSVTGTAVGNAGGGFDIFAPRLWNVPGTFALDIALSSSAGGTATATSHVTVLAETLTLAANNLAVIQTGSTSGVVAHFSSDLAHLPADFTVDVSYSDGTTSAATVVAHAGGGFDVVASRPWNVAGSFTMTVQVSDDLGAFATAFARVTVTPRILSATAPALSAAKGTAFTGTLATFTDNLSGTTAGSYLVTITWSDGLTTAATLTRNPDGSFAIGTSRTFSSTGTLTTTITITTADNLISTSLTQDWSITNKNDKVPPGKKK